MITYHTAKMQLYILGMITYHDQYISLYKRSMITYYIFSDGLIFLTRYFYSEYNCLINHNTFVLYKAGYKNPNTNPDSFYYWELQQFYVFTGIVNCAIIIILIFVSTCLYTEYIPQNIFLLYFCGILYPHDFGHYLVGSKIIQLATDFQYKLTCTGF